MVWVPYRHRFSSAPLDRKTTHIYVANWFYGAFIITVALLHIWSIAQHPGLLTKSYSAYAGVQDAMIQWWYGHNAVGFFPDRGLPGHDVLLRSEAGWSPGLFLSSVGGPFLGADLHSTCGRARTTCTTRAA